ncbi:type I phosphomannose isomerase catalytic subunit [Candidatus Leptofilum sp.]|uniref:type I phosphomannose isomerase catalytic subunit n=1 Tax=Candidatus Leptofilum sp. TaxID=3241576 RepID=UPI003B5A7E6A
MTQYELYPLLFEPVLKDYIWGGRNLEKLGRKLPAEGVIAESWEIAGHEDGTTRVANGRFAGKLLAELHQELGLDLIGSRSAWAQERGKFPLLIKLLDANRPLSVQVHPQDDYALENEGNELGKTEMWVVLQAKPGAEVILGVSHAISQDEFRVAIKSNQLEPHLHRIQVKAGDHICVPAGSLHAIMDGLLIAEIQQNSNTTYRVYDWGRVGADGRPRSLHVDKALDVINFEQIAPKICPPEPISDENGVRRSLLCQNEYFVTERVEMAAGSTFSGNCTGETMEIWGVMEGVVSVNDLVLTAVRFVLLPAAMGKFAIIAQSSATLLRSYVAA